VRLVIQIKGIRNQFFQLDFRCFKTRTVVAAIATGTVPTRTRTPIALRTVSAAILTIRTTALPRAPIAALGTVALWAITLWTAFALRPVALRTWTALAFRPALPRGFCFWSFRFHFGLALKLDAAQHSSQRILQRCSGVSHGSFRRRV
jgi:hypothetical protein